MMMKKANKSKNSRARFSVSSSSFLVFKEVLLEAALFKPALAEKYK